MKTVLIFLAYLKLSYVQITLKASYQYVAIISFVKIKQIPKKKMARVYWSLNVKRRLDMEISNIETLWTEVSLLNAKPFLICSVYSPPTASSDWIDAFEEELSIAQTTGLEFILMGDFNIDITHT